VVGYGDGVESPDMESGVMPGLGWREGTGTRKVEIEVFGGSLNGRKGYLPRSYSFCVPQWPSVWLLLKTCQSPFPLSRTEIQVPHGDFRGHFPSACSNLACYRMACASVKVTGCISVQKSVMSMNVKRGKREGKEKSCPKREARHQDRVSAADIT
jgi:hypothetical protein